MRSTVFFAFLILLFVESLQAQGWQPSTECRPKFGSAKDLFLGNWITERGVVLWQASTDPNILIGSYRPFIRNKSYEGKIIAEVSENKISSSGQCLYVLKGNFYEVLDTDSLKGGFIWMLAPEQSTNQVSGQYQLAGQDSRQSWKAVRYSYEALTSLNDQLGAVLDAAAGDFRDIIAGIDTSGYKDIDPALSADEKELHKIGKRYVKSKVSLQGAERCTIVSNRVDMVHQSFVASYGKFPNQEKAREQYDKLNQYLQTYNFTPRCLFHKNSQNKPGDVRTYTLYTMNFIHSPKSYTDVVISVEMEKLLGSEEWKVTLWVEKY